MRVKNLGHNLIRTCARQQAATLASFYVGLFVVAKRKRTRALCTRRLRKALIETAPRTTRDMHHHRVKHRSPGEVRIKALIQKLPQETPALRNAERDGGFALDDGRRVVAYPRHQVTYARQRQPRELRVFGRVSKAVIRARLKAAFQMDVRRAIHQRAILDTRKRPLLARHTLLGCGARCRHSEPRLWRL